MNDDDDFKDTRTKEQRIGAIPTQKNNKKSVTIAVPAPARRPGTDLNAAEKALRMQSRKLALDYCDQMILNLVDIAMHGTNESSRVDASKQILHMGLGRPSTVHVGSDGQQIIPNFTIVFGDQPLIQQIEADDYQYTESEDE